MNRARCSKNGGVGTAEKVIGLVVLACLCAVLVWVLIRQAQFNPAVGGAHTDAAEFESGSEMASEVESGSAPVSTPTGFGRLAPDALVAMGEPEQFDQDTLSDKIDGKAELYLACGFELMRCQRFALKSAPELWLEWFEYDMGDPHNAFAVYSQQRRAGAEPLELTPYAYRAKNGLYYVAGRYYVEALAAEPDQRLVSAMLEMAKKHVSGLPEAQQPLVELGLFPARDLIPHSHVLQLKSAFGFERFTKVFTARYSTGGAETLAFVAPLGDRRTAETVAREYNAFLIANGGRSVNAPDIPGAAAVELYGGLELVFPVGAHVAGVHAATNQPAAIAVAKSLFEHISRAQ